MRNATIHAAISLEVQDGQARLGAYASAPRQKAAVRLAVQGKLLWQRQANLSPESPLIATVPLPARTSPQDIELSVCAADGERLVSYSPEPRQPEAMPEPALAIAESRKLTGSEALLLAGLHLEQYRHATREPEDYYQIGRAHV